MSDFILHFSQLVQPYRELATQVSSPNPTAGVKQVRFAGEARKEFPPVLHSLSRRRLRGDLSGLWSLLHAEAATLLKRLAFTIYQGHNRRLR